MSTATPRLRVFAGPNGSGKSTLKDRLLPEWLGVYVNADEIEKTIRTKASLSLSEFSISAAADELAAFLRASTLLTQQGQLGDADCIRLQGDLAVFKGLGGRSDRWCHAGNADGRHAPLVQRRTVGSVRGR